MINIMLIITNFYLIKCIDFHVCEPDLALLQQILDANTSNTSIDHSQVWDFDYNTIKLSDLCQLKMPYINCNRRIFANSNKNLIDILLLDNELQALLLQTTNTFKAKVENVRHSISNMLGIVENYEFKLSDEKKYTSENLLGIEKNSLIKKCLNDEFIKINTALKLEGAPSINRILIQTLLGAIDSYVFEDFKRDNLFIYCLKP